MLFLFFSGRPRPFLLGELRINTRLFVKKSVPLLTTPAPEWYFCTMKTKFHFTRGEWAAALFLLTIMTAGNIYYFVRDTHPKPSRDAHRYEALFQQFADEQRRLDDSLAEAREQTFRTRPTARADTTPPFRKQEHKPMYDVVRIDINSCDTDQLVTVPQFGSKRAAKLVEYRERLGGFHSFSQLQEVYVLQNIDTTKLKTYRRLPHQADPAPPREKRSHPKPRRTATDHPRISGIDREVETVHLLLAIWLLAIGCALARN